MMRRLIWMFVFCSTVEQGMSQSLAVDAQAIAPALASLSVQTAPLDASKPLFIPTHPRVTTTIRFPSPIGAPDGRGFTEDEVKQPGEYLLSWTQGEAHFTLTPLVGAGPLNLNVPYKGATYVLYFYPVEQQFQALASLNIISEENTSAKASAQGVSIGWRSTEAPVKSEQALTPARALGLLDRLKALRAQPDSDRLASMASGLKLELALNAKLISCSGKNGTPVPPSALADLPMDFGLFELRLLAVALDRRFCAIGFVVTAENRSKQALAFDVASFAARQGARYYPQVLSDAAPILAPGERKDAFFVIRYTGETPPALTGDWRVSLDLLSPKLPPGAAAVSEYSRQGP